MSNRLEHEKSPYLLQHKDNTVDWYPWCREAFEKAVSEDKPVFLSIGYSTCHWCHVMAHESFEDAEVGALLAGFVCIKVDREERPDIYAVYMEACQALTGSGGWPLTVCMTPRQEPFFAGTYFPKRARYGQPGLMELLPRLLTLWDTDRERLVQAAKQLTGLLSRQAGIQSRPAAGAQGQSVSEARKGVSAGASDRPEAALLYRAYHNLCRSFDPDWGGFGPAPKFPSPHILLFLLRCAEEEAASGGISASEDSPQRYFTAKDMTQALPMTEATLQAMAAGGIFDQIGGGFSRYSTDRQWQIPHFEKMLYDNALLLLTYCEAFRQTGNPLYKDVARRTVGYILRELADGEGGFYSGQDADSDGVEGKYYAFTPEEVRRVLGRRDGKEFCRRYDISEKGNFEGKSIPDRIGIRDTAWTAEDPRLLRLYEYRRARTELFTDHKILLSWNSWTIAALVRAGVILNDRSFTRAAMEAQRWISRTMTDQENHLFLRFCGNEAAQAGQLYDYAVYALALLELYRGTFEIRYLSEAVLRAGQIQEFFEDRENGGCFMTAHRGERLITRPKESYDGALPSGNSVTALVWEQLARLTGRPQFQEAAGRQHRYMAGQMEAVPQAYCFGLLALTQALAPHRELLFTGNQVPKELTAWLREHPASGLSILWKTADNEAELSGLAPFTAAYPVSEETVWYLCENGACRAPVRRFEELGL